MSTSAATRVPPSLFDTLRRLSANRRDATEPTEEHTTIECALTGEPLSWVHTGTADDVTAAMSRARQAQQEWAAVPLHERQDIIRSFHDMVLRNRSLLMDIIQLETGKNRGSAHTEVLDVAGNCRYYANKAPKLLAGRSLPGALPFASRAHLDYAPKGVVGQISPWNYPLTLAISDAIPALLAGNTVVAKPDSCTPFSALICAHLLYEAGLPRNVLQFITGPGREVGTAIAKQCDYLMFTGSTATGRILGAIAGERLIGYSAELGGKNPMVIAADANLTKAAHETAQACFANSGQLCVSIERIIVEEAAYDEFVDRFRTEVENMRVGCGFSWDDDMGSLINQKQLNTVQRYVDDAIEQGATVISGGRHRPDLGPYVYEPTVLIDVPHSAKLYTEEVFGPVVYITKAATLDAAIEQANDTDYGLNAAVCARPSTGWEAAHRINAGGVGINDGFAAAWGTIDGPLGGMKQSGLARRHGSEGLLKYTEPRLICEQRALSMHGLPPLSRKTHAAIMAWALQAGKTLKLLP